MILGAAKVSLIFGGGRNTLTLGNGGASLSVATPIRGTTSTAFVVTNGSGGLTINNPALTSFFFPIGYNLCDLFAAFIKQCEHSRCLYGASSCQYH